jgi:hypothetical protein
MVRRRAGAIERFIDTAAMAPMAGGMSDER